MYFKRLVNPNEKHIVIHVRTPNSVKTLQTGLVFYCAEKGPQRVPMYRVHNFVLRLWG